MDVQELIAYLLSPVAQIGLIIGLAEIVKQFVDKKWIPIFDVLCGVLSGVLVYGLVLGYGIGQSIVLGIAMGLSACGLFSGIKNLTEGMKNAKGD